MHISQGDLTVRPLHPEDIDALQRWLTDERVLAFYEGRDHPFSRDMIRAKYFTQSARHINRELILWQEQPIGYMQIYPLSREEFDAYGYCYSQKILGMDQFIGEVAYWNHGIGTFLMQTVCSWLETHHQPDCLVVDPRIDNLRAIHVYEKCGFRKVKRLIGHERHEGIDHDCWLMERKRYHSRLPRSHVIHVR
ncbi:GNAT family N-acetyltransferase [Sulfobacillus thermosulfidooxidans]|uniref:GNAT family N-acetyltransferase n=1 Tax=Sulfobacillus thermosulfidooxidans TaxID=28034 RepID=UPI0006B4D0CF|nr:GNAT family N-acetyltransferase [Sulfobacillus thermosulfidooxidans]